MRNFDRLTENQIIDALSGGGIAVNIENGEVSSCDVLLCEKCKFNTNRAKCAKKQREWLLADTLLSDAERHKIESIFIGGQVTKDVIGIGKHISADGSKYCIEIYLENGAILLPEFPIDSEMYRGLEPERGYRLEELGLNVKVEE